MQVTIFWNNGTYDMDSATTYGFSMARRCFIGTFNTAIGYNVPPGTKLTVVVTDVATGLSARRSVAVCGK